MLYDSCLCDLHRFTLRFLTVLSRMSSCRSFFPSVHVHTKSLYPLYSFFVFFRCSLQFCTWQCMFLSVNLFLSMLVLCLCLCCACVGVSVLCFVRSKSPKQQTVPSFICFYPKVLGLTELQTVQLDNPSNRAGSKTEAFQISKQYQTIAFLACTVFIIQSLKTQEPIPV